MWSFLTTKLQCSRQHNTLRLILGAGLLAFAFNCFAYEIPVSVDFSPLIPAQPPVIVVVPPDAPTQVFPSFVLIPVDITSTIPGKPVNTLGLRVDYLYTVVSADDSTVLIPEKSVTVTFLSSSDRTKLRGTAIVSLDQFRNIRAGDKMQYRFKVTQVGFPVPPSALNEVSFVKKMSFQINDKTSQIALPSLNFLTGATALTFRPGSLKGSGVLTVEQDPEIALPSGPKGLTPALATVYRFSVEGATLHGPIDLQFAAPIEADGTMIDSSAQISDLVPFWLEKNDVTGQVYGWRRVGRPQADAALRTVKVQTSKTGTFALFATGPVQASDLRPLERIITPNSDGINDTAQFLGLTADDEMKIFDMRGRRVKSLRGPDPIWDGTEDDGHIAESGVYLYQYTSQGERTSGVIVVAK